MPSEIKFSSFGLPSLVEFANASIRSPGMMFKKSKGKGKPTRSMSFPAPPPPPPPPPKRCATCGHVSEHQAARALAVEDDNLLKVPTTTPPRPGGLYIRFHGQAADAALGKISERRLLKLRWTIAEAVTKAGMSTPANEAGDPMDSRSSDGTETVRSTDSSKQALFKGTYGQVKEALKNAGLTTTPCAEGGFEHGKQL